jgi:hypothetical protein
MIKFKACPKCKGDLRIERDSYGSYVQCFQCSRLVDLEAPSRDHLLQKAG